MKKFIFNNITYFSFQIPEYCKAMDEQDIVNNSFNLIFAFDEIVALGYRENVNLAQIRTFVEMDSHEEKVYQAVRQVFLFLCLIILKLLIEALNAFFHIYDLNVNK